MRPKIVTLGVYGFDEMSFFQTLQDAHVDTFCDIRGHRGMRGTTYTFANKVRLKWKLAEMNVRYVHLKQLAPSRAMRQLQTQEDKQLRIHKRKRTTLGKAFTEVYEQECLGDLNAEELLRQLGPEAQVICFFCVEGTAAACHRGLVARWLAQYMGFEVEHLEPP